MMKTTCLFTILLLAVVGCTESRESLLEKTLANVEKVKSAAYTPQRCIAAMTGGC